ncbi:MAG: glycosyltransferase [Planctomycetota bacterium]
MILLTVGTQCGFDRLVRAVDEWAGEKGSAEVFAQIGKGEYEPRNMRWVRNLEPGEFLERVRRSTALIAHAGMGSIIRALEHGKPIVVMPRRARFREHRNDHQVATARRLRELPLVHVALDELERRQRLAGLADMSAGEAIAGHASERLLDALGRFIDGRPLRCGREPACEPIPQIEPKTPTRERAVVEGS